MVDLRIATAFSEADWAAYESIYRLSWKPKEGSPAFLRRFAEAEGAAGFAKSTGDIKFDLNRNHSSLAYVAWGPEGLKHTLAEARTRHALT